MKGDHADQADHVYIKPAGQPNESSLALFSVRLIRSTQQNTPGLKYI